MITLNVGVSGFFGKTSRKIKINEKTWEYFEKETDYYRYIEKNTLSKNRRLLK